MCELLSKAHNLHRRPRGWMSQWMELQQWVFPQRFFRENLKLGDGGEEGRENDIVREVTA